MFMFARHGVENPVTKQFEDSVIKNSALQTEEGEMCKQLLQRVKEAR
jgi:hypothetical protein